MTLHLTVPSMACSACAETIAKAVRSIDAAAQVTADPKTKRCGASGGTPRSH
ncbi:MAG: heavy-metal-associated domain-containing protein [Acaryochloridaceae cyanobacterium RU_4_10]|nr:heavy-metal-associated domain-containing protein [Acaryochloridaceae cyanobacterium RU_4_10]